MTGILVAIHVFVCVILIVIVLLQGGRGAEIGAVFGGGASTTLFGSAGPASFLNRVTTVVAIIFMLSSLFLTFLASRPITKTVVDKVPQQQEAPVAPAPQK